jgi:hypothetical protein
MLKNLLKHELWWWIYVPASSLHAWPVSSSLHARPVEFIHVAVEFIRGL